MLLVYFFFVFIGYVDSNQNSSCSPLNLKNGRVRYSSYLADLKCKRNYVLIGEKVDVCYNGTWLVGNQICARKDCPKLPKPYHGTVVYTNKKAVAEFKCDNNFILVGSRELYCLDDGWNGSVPTCEAKYLEMFKPCHFEIDDPAHCHWLLKPSVFKWVVYPMENMHPDSVADDLPLYDHSLAPHIGGHYLLLVRQDAKSKWTQEQNSPPEAQFISPQFPPTTDSKEPLCLIFYYYFSEGATLRVLVNNETIWMNNRPIEREWTEAKISLQNQPYAFRIIVEGVKNSKNRSTLAIDDLRLDTSGSCRGYSSGVILPQPSDTISYTSQPSNNLDQRETDKSTVSTTVEDISVSKNDEWSISTTSVPIEYFTEPADFEKTGTADYEQTPVLQEITPSLPNAIDLQEIPATTYIFSMPEPVSPNISSLENIDELSRKIYLKSAIDRFQKVFNSSINVTSLLQPRSNSNILESIQHKIRSTEPSGNTQESQETTTNASSTHLSTSIIFDNASRNVQNPAPAKKIDPDTKIETPSTEETKIYKKTAIPPREIHQNIESDLKYKIITDKTLTEETLDNGNELDRDYQDYEYPDPENNVNVHHGYQEPAVQTQQDSNPTPVHSQQKITSLPILVIYVLVILLSLITPALVYFSSKLVFRYMNKRRGEVDNIKLVPQDRESIVELSSSYPLTTVGASD